MLLASAIAPACACFHHFASLRLINNKNAGARKTGGAKRLTERILFTLFLLARNNDDAKFVPSLISWRWLGVIFNGALATEKSTELFSAQIGVAPSANARLRARKWADVNTIRFYASRACFLFHFQFGFVFNMRAKLGFLLSAHNSCK